MSLAFNGCPTRASSLAIHLMEIKYALVDKQFSEHFPTECEFE
jgi:hypothetical protein